jgi:hypothetical protein
MLKIIHRPRNPEIEHPIIPRAGKPKRRGSIRLVITIDETTRRKKAKIPPFLT